MKRLIEKDDLGNWCLKGVRWEQLRAGQVITKEVSEALEMPCMTVPIKL